VLERVVRRCQWDCDGSTSKHIGREWDCDGSTSKHIGREWDCDGSTSNHTLIVGVYRFHYFMFKFSFEMPAFVAWTLGLFRNDELGKKCKCKAGDP
jgi:hypothetical protein